MRPPHSTRRTSRRRRRRSDFLNRRLARRYIRRRRRLRWTKRHRRPIRHSLRNRHLPAHPNTGWYPECVQSCRRLGPWRQRRPNRQNNCLLRRCLLRSKSPLRPHHCHSRWVSMRLQRRFRPPGRQRRRPHHWKRRCLYPCNRCIACPASLWRHSPRSACLLSPHHRPRPPRGWACAVKRSEMGQRQRTWRGSCHRRRVQNQTRHTRTGSGPRQ